MRALLALEDGKVFEGVSFGAGGESTGEVIFNTSMMGYQEILTDPSYQGQIVVMTYPLIGNYGLNQEDFESRQPFVSGFVVREECSYPSNWRSQYSLGQFLKKYNIVGISEIYTRALTKHIRDFGAKKGIISTLDFDKYSLIRKAKASPGLIGRDLVVEVSCHSEYPWRQKNGNYNHQKKYKVIAYDYGIKYNIL